MKEFKVRSGNFLKSSNSTSNMMYTILVVLIPFIIFSTYKNGIYHIRIMYILYPDELKRVPVLPNK